LLIASWNVNSIRKRLNQVILWLESKNPDVLCLQETKVLDAEFPFETFEKLGYKVKVFGQKSYNGVAIISKFDFVDLKYGFSGELAECESAKNFDKQKRVISALINDVRIINIYVPNGSSLNSEKFEYKLSWLKQLKIYLEESYKREEKTCLLGDFNIAPTSKDIHDQIYEGNIMASEKERSCLEKIVKGRFIDSFRIFEKNSGYWSWWDYRNNAFELNKGWRIDHIYICNDLLFNLKSSVIDKDQREFNQPSDHAPVMIDLNFQENFDDIGDDDDLFAL
tara:strand:- start:57 stop:896 length:840 start_codon:yes stop_codon:yes gene_type:complete